MVLERLLRQALGVQKTGLTEPVNAADWATLARHGMLPLYRTYGGKPVENTLSVELAMQESIARGISRQQQKALIQLHDAVFDEAPSNEIPHGFKLGLIKGAALANSIYPDPDCRPMADIDLLVEPEHACFVREALYGLGYEDYHSPHVGEQGRDHHGVPLRHSAKGVWIEIHTALFPSDDPLASAFPNPCQDLQELRVQDRLFYTLPIQTSFLYVLAHWAQMPQPQGKFHGLIDIALLLRQNPTALMSVMNGVTHKQLARCVLLVAKLLQGCGEKELLRDLQWPVLSRTAQLDGLRLRTMAALAYQLSISGRGFFAIAGRNLCAQWWRELLASRHSSDAIFKMLLRLFVPHDYGGRRGWLLSSRRLKSFAGRLFNAVNNRQLGP